MSAKKSRFDGLDVLAMTSHLRRVMLGFKVANVYDGSALGVGDAAGSSGGGGGKGSAKGSVYIFKLADPSGGGAAAPGASSSSSGGTSGGAAGGSATMSSGTTPNDPSGSENVTSRDASDDPRANRNPANEADPSPIPQQNNEKEEGNSKRAMLLLESGVRFHPTSHYSPSTNLPSNFCTKLRKHLRNLRLENVTQLGNLDRVVDFRFGSGSMAHHLILELYAQGNIILCDGEYKILALLRTHEYSVTVESSRSSKDGGDNEEKKERDNAKKEEVKVRVGNIYPVTFATTLTAAGNQTNESLSDKNKQSNGQNASVSSPSNAKGLLSLSSDDAYEWGKAELLSIHQRARDNNGEGKGGKKKKGGGGGGKKKSTDNSLVLKALLLKPNSGVYHYGPSLIEHCIWTAGLDPLLKLTHENLEYTLPPASWNDLINSLQAEGSKIIHNLSSGESGGYILYQPKESSKEEGEKKNDSLLPNTIANPHADKILQEFQPHLLYQHRRLNSNANANGSSIQFLTYTTFAIATDTFFTHLSTQRLSQKADAAENAARDRLLKIQADQQRRVDALVEEQQHWKNCARLVEMHAGDVDRALGVINGALETGMDWEALEKLVSVEQANENPIALLIYRLELEKEMVVLALPDIDNWDDTDPETPPPICNVEVKLKESAHGNARDMFTKYRASKEKEEKTMEASSAALKAAEAKAKLQLAEAQKKKQLIQVLPPRKPYWFEKFAWFITSDNYLVVAGRDAQQNEQLVKRYLRPGDAYLHAEVFGASSCILRAKRRRRPDGKTRVLPLSDQALREAGSFTICRSSAWSSKMVTSAYWVESHQVSKTAPTGEYLTVGAFMIRGRKNFLPATSLEMGLGVLFRLGDEASVNRHMGERRDFMLLEQEQLEEDEISEMKEKGNAISKLKDDGDEKVVSLTAVEDEKTDSQMVEKEEVGDSERVQSEIEAPELEEEREAISPPRKEAFSHQPYSRKNKASNNLKQATAKTNNKPSNTNDNTNNNSKKKTKEPSRGKRSKDKRALKKYCDQDEEDRELAMMALHGGLKLKKGRRGAGSKNNKLAQESETQLKAAADTAALLMRDSERVANTLEESVRTVLAKCVTVVVAPTSRSSEEEGQKEEIRWNKFDAEVLEQLKEMETLEEQVCVADRLLDLSNTTRIDNFSASLAGIIRTVKKHGVDNIAKSRGDPGGDGKQRKTKADKIAEKEVWQEILAEDGLLENDTDDGSPVDDSAELAKLTGKPTSEDVILCAVPVCAPYHVLSQYKYRVKLTPGSVKRGKASKQCVEMFLHSESDKKKSAVDSNSNASKRDRELIKLVNENEWVQAIIGDVRITSAGASKAAKKQKGNKNKSKK